MTYLLVCPLWSTELPWSQVLNALETFWMEIKQNPTGLPSSHYAGSLRRQKELWFQSQTDVGCGPGPVTL